MLRRHGNVARVGSTVKAALRARVARTIRRLAFQHTRQSHVRPARHVLVQAADNVFFESIAQHVDVIQYKGNGGSPSRLVSRVKTIRVIRAHDLLRVPGNLFAQKLHQGIARKEADVLTLGVLRRRLLEIDGRA